MILDTILYSLVAQDVRKKSPLSFIQNTNSHYQFSWTFCVLVNVDIEQFVNISVSL